MCSPFENQTPAQFVFLVALVTTTLTITLISHRLREKREYYRAKKGRANVTRFDLARGGVHTLDWLAFFQLLLIISTLVRIGLSALCLVSPFYDFVLIIAAFITIGLLWLCIFIAVTPKVRLVLRQWWRWWVDC